MKVQHQVVVFAASGLLLTVTASAAQNAECVRAKQLAEVVAIDDLSQTIQLPIVAADGKTIQAFETIKTSSFKITLIGQDGMKFALILPERPPGRILETNVEVCATTAKTRMHPFDDFSSVETNSK